MPRSKVISIRPSAAAAATTRGSAASVSPSANDGVGIVPAPGQRISSGYRKVLVQLELHRACGSGSSSSRAGCLAILPREILSASRRVRSWRDVWQVGSIAAGRDHPFSANGCSVCVSESFEAAKLKLQTLARLSGWGHFFSPRFLRREGAHGADVTRGLKPSRPICPAKIPPEGK